MVERLQSTHNAFLLCLALASALNGCSGYIDQPSGSASCASCELDDNGAAGDPDAPIGIGDPSTPNGVGWSTRFPRLSNAQWENTVKDLFYLDAITGLAADFTQEPLDKSYSSGAAAELTVGQAAWSRYQTGAEKVAVAIVGNGTALAKLIGTASGDATAQAKTFITTFGLRAFRRPLTTVEVDAYLRLFQQGPQLVGGDAVGAGVRLVIEAMLQSPHFLYRVEASDKIDPKVKRKAWLSGYEVATRLSYALWNTMPSDALLKAAGAGELDTAEGVAKWANSLLDDERAAPILLSFHEQTFSISAYGTQDKDPKLDFDANALAPIMQDEARLFFQELIVKGDAGIREILTSPLAFVNEDTAPLYGLSGVVGQTLQKQTLNDKERAGLLTQLGFLTKNATRSTSDPVHRGLVVLRKVLCDEPDPPPMTFKLPSAEVGLTTREVYEKATACGVGCHDTLINPSGFAFETFDAIGRVRATEQGKPIDAKASLTLRVGYSSREKQANPTTKISFDGPVDLMTQLAKQPRVHECYARNWMEYALAREVNPVERGAWELLRDRSLKQGAGRDLLVALVQLDTFRSRISE